MTQIGFAYNEKPEPAAVRVDDAIDASPPDEEPPSKRRDDRSRTSASPDEPGALAVSAPHAAGSRRNPTEDEFAEWDDAETIAAVERALSSCGEVVRLEADADFPQRLRDAAPDIVFNIAEGMFGVNREAHVPAICEFFGIPYSGSDPFTLSLCLDKARAKEALAYHGVPTAPFTLIRAVDEIAGLGRRLGRQLRLPLFVKPVHEGSSKGITERNFCRTRRELEAQVAFLLERYRQPVLVEEYLPGAEFTCAILGNNGGAELLPIVGLNFEALPEGALPLYGFEAKWLWDRPENPLEMFVCPARIDEKLRRRIEEIVLAAYRVLACRDWSRIDVRLDAAGVPNVVEVNPLPGILPNPEDNSCFPKAVRAAGMSYDELIQACLHHAASRQGVHLDAPQPGKVVRVPSARGGAPVLERAAAVG
ncbi:MAG: D-alanine--D-alanine ligase [Gemmatimonadota bacterium]|nr:D-alanine--D-alanine ligase [Gemmatimonadota bacterium]